MSDKKLVILEISPEQNMVKATCKKYFLCFFSLCDVRKNAVFLILEHSSLKRIKQKKHKKKHEILTFKPLFQKNQIEKPDYQKDFLKL